MKGESGDNWSLGLSCVGIEIWFSLLTVTLGKLLDLPLAQYPYSRIVLKVERVNSWKALGKESST